MNELQTGITWEITAPLIFFVCIGIYYMFRKKAKPIDDSVDKIFERELKESEDNIFMY